MNAPSKRRVLVLALYCCAIVEGAPAQHIQWVQPNPGAFVGPNSPGCCFRSVTSDLNGDGIADILAHDGTASIGGLTAAGRVAVFSGADGSMIRVHQGTASLEFLQLCGGSIGDLSGDGVPEYLTSSQVQGVRIVSGATGAFSAPVPVLCGLWSLGLGDVNGDGVNDFVVASGACATTISGVTHLALHTVCQPPGMANSFGKSMDTVGDVDGDGVLDFVIGAPTYFPPQIGNVVGHAYLVSGASGTVLHTWSTTGMLNRFGETVSGLGDVDGDGRGDVLVGAPAYGQAHVYSCVPPYAQIYALAGTGQPAWNVFGLMSAGLGDLDGDGWPDYALMVESGVVAVKSGPSGDTLYALPTPSNYYLLGLGRGGDTDSDGFEDVLMGLAPFTTGAYAFAGISTIPVGVTPLGKGCPQSTGVEARIGATRPATTGQTFGITVSLLPPKTPVGLIVGVSSTQFGTVQLPWDLASVGAPGCILYESMDVFLPGAAALASGVSGGALVLATIVPPGLVGSTFFAQWAVANPPGSASPASLTRALSITIQ